MEDQEVVDPDEDLQIQQTLLAASQHNIPQLRSLLRNGSASVQDPETGFTPLHAAIAACEPSQSPKQNGIQVNRHISDGHAQETEGDESLATQDEDIKRASKTVELLLENGAIWNDVDNNNATPGCLALRVGLKELYNIMVDAGVRAEILLNRLDEYEQLGDGADEDIEADDVVKAEQAVAEVPQEAGVQATPPAGSMTDTINSVEVSNEEFLRSDLRFQDGRILDNSRNGVMMTWETDIMKRTADLLCPRSDLRILNIGHGMGIIDSFLQDKSPTAHHIIEAHPAVLAQMRRDGWYDKSNITVHEGKWQDVVPRIMEQGQMFDVIYFDTFAEDYKALRDFFSDYVLGLLEDGGRWGFFNGLGADRQICYDVYGKVVEMDLFEAGFDTEWETLQVPDLEDNDEWKDMRRKYWTLKEYKLPICCFAG